jgi:hypothetical protein
MKSPGKEQLMSRRLRIVGLIAVIILATISIIRCGGSSFEWYDPVDTRVYPSVTTLPATNILPHSAILEGTFNPNGVEHTAWFKWGGDPALIDYDEAWGVTDSGTSTIDLSIEINQLSSDAAYYFRAVSGTVSGAILNFKTPYVTEPYWARTYGGKYNEYPSMISLTTDGGYLVTASTSSYITGEEAVYGTTNNTNLWIIKLNSEGKIVWQKQYREPNSYAYSGAGYQISNGEIIVVANYKQSIDQSRSYPLFLRLSGDGSVISQKIFNNGYISTAVIDSNDNLLVAGSYRDTAGNRDYWLLKLNNTGQILWEKSYGTEQTNDVLSAIVQTANGYMMAGARDGDSWLVEIDQLGNILWQKLYSCNIPTGEALPVNGVAYDSNDGYTLVGDSINMLIARVGLDGSVQWVKKYGSGEGHTIANSGDGGYVIGGRGASNGLTKIDKDGGIIWSKLYGTKKGYVTSTALDVSNDIIFTSIHDAFPYDYNTQVAKLPANGLLPPIATDISVTPEDMECSFQENTFVTATATSVTASSSSVSAINTFATILQQAP